jgi:hypothetical protein
MESPPRPTIFAIVLSCALVALVPRDAAEAYSLAAGADHAFEVHAQESHGAEWLDAIDLGGADLRSTSLARSSLVDAVLVASLLAVPWRWTRASRGRTWPARSCARPC